MVLRSDREGVEEKKETGAETRMRLIHISETLEFFSFFLLLTIIIVR
jgi:hypothetical protein